MELFVICDSCLQASTFFRTASWSPDKCLWPSLSIDCKPYGRPWPAILTRGKNAQTLLCGDMFSHREMDDTLTSCASTKSHRERIRSSRSKSVKFCLLRAIIAMILVTDILLRSRVGGGAAGKPLGLQHEFGSARFRSFRQTGALTGSARNSSLW